MEFHPGRILGIILGLVILATTFLLPFNGTGSNSLYGIVSPSISNLGAVQAAGTAVATYAYIFIIAFILIVIAGIVGLFPLGTGVLGVVGMAMITVAPYLVYPNGPVRLDPGLGFYVIWVASIASLGASFWHRRRSQAQPPVNVMVTQTTTVGGQQPTSTSATTSTTPAQIKCPTCGTMNPAAFVKCSKCGADLPKQA